MPTRAIIKPPGYEDYLSVNELMEQLGIKTSKRIRDDIHAGILEAVQLPTGRFNEPFLIAPEKAMKYKKDRHTPKPYVPRCG